jgi:WD40 repeat protein
MNNYAGWLLLFLAGWHAAPDAPPPLQQREPLVGHSTVVTCIVFSPDGKKLVSCSFGDKANPAQRTADIRVWDVAKEKEFARLAGHKDQVSSAAFSPDGKTLATLAGGEVILWDMTTNAERTKLAGPRGYSPGGKVAFSSDGKKLGAAWHKDVWLWDAESGKEIRTFTRTGSPYSYYFAPGGFNPDLSLLASTHYQDVDLWDTTKGKERKVLPDHRGSVTTMAFTPDGKTLAVAVQHEEEGKYANEIRLWDVDKGVERKTLSGHADYIGPFALSPDGKWIAFVNGAWGLNEWELRLLDVTADRVVAKLPLRRQRVFSASLQFSPDGKILAAGCNDGTVQLWDFVLPKEK